MLNLIEPEPVARKYLRRSAYIWPLNTVSIKSLYILRGNVLVLTICQALMISSASLVVFSGSLVGNQLASDEKLSTLPVALMTIGSAVSSVPVALLMQRFGRKMVFLTVALLGACLALLTAWSIVQQSFLFFCISIFLLGLTISAVQQFRFAAMESVQPDQIPKAASQVLLAGIVAAYIGPEVALRGKDLTSNEFSGSFMLLAILYFLGFLFLCKYRNTVIKKEEGEAPQRSLGRIARQPVFWVAVLGAVVGYSVMSFIMTATPISMHVMHGHTLENTKWVIQSHIMAMFLPSLITAWIIRKLGIPRMMLAGIAAFIICLILAYSGVAFFNFWLSLILLGIGWNFLFIGGTTLLPSAYSAGERFKVQALNEFMVFGTQAFASISAGWVLFQLGWGNLLLITIPMLAVQVTAIATWRLSKKKTGPPAMSRQVAE